MLGRTSSSRLSVNVTGWLNTANSLPNLNSPTSPTSDPHSPHPHPHHNFHSVSYPDLNAAAGGGCPVSPTLLHSSSPLPHSNSTSYGVIKGRLQRKGMWTGWTDAYYHVTDGGMLFEFKNEQATKPVRVLQLPQCTVQLAENLTGKPFSFVITCPKTEDLFLRAPDETRMVEWVSTIGKHCTAAPVQWGTDSFLEAFVDAVVISSEDGTVLGVNQKTCDMFGYEKHELMGQCVDILCPPVIQSAHAQYMKNYINTGEKKLIGKPRNVPVKHKNGDIFRAILSLGEKKGDDGQRRFIATLRSEHSFSQEKVKETICSSLDLNLDNFGKVLKEAVLGQISDVFDTMEQLRAKNKQLSTQLAIQEKTEKRASKENIHSCQLNLDNLIIHEKLAATGGSGASVFSCTVDGFRCAMKELHLAESTSADINSFAAEILLLERIPFHKNVVRYLFHTRTETTLRLFMTQYTGTLSRLITRKANEKSSFSQQDVMRFFLDMVNGLDALHNMKIVHRDMKSDNIFYSLGQDGNVSHLSIGDLDTAKVVSINKNTTTVVGTPGYMAPEVLLGNKYNHEVDVWSIGMIVYELLMLQRPYSNASIFQVAQLVINGELPTLSDAAREKYSKVIPLWEECVRTDPKRRPTLEMIKTVLFKMLMD